MRGKISAIILCTLKSDNLYGLQIIKAIKTLTNGQIDIKLPSLYSTLHKLEAEEYITSYWENSEIGGKRRYSALTEKGRQYVNEHPLDFSEFEKVSNQNANNSPTSLAIQPDFFNTIAHAERAEKNLNKIETEHDKVENEIPNYSILDYISTDKLNAVNSALGGATNTNLNSAMQNENYNTSFDNIADDNSNVQDLSIDNQQLGRVDEHQPEKTYQRVYDKNDAVLLSDNEIIPHNESLSLLYRPTTITKNEIKSDDIDYDSIFGDMIEKDIAKTTLFGTQNDGIDNATSSNETIEHAKIDIFDRKPLNTNESIENLDNANNVLDNNNSKINILGLHNAEESGQSFAKDTLFKSTVSQQTIEQNNATNATINNSTIDNKQLLTQEKTRKNINEYLLKDKIVVEDKYKANIFLKKSNFSNSEYDFFSTPPKYSKDNFKEIEPPQHKKIDIFFNNDNDNDTIENSCQSQLKTLDEFIVDCEENGIEISVFNNSCKTKVKSNNVHANRTNLLTAIISFGTLTALLLTLFFVYKTPENFNSLTTMVITIFALSMLYPILCAIFLIKNDRIGIPVCNIKKEWIPRSIIVVSIVLLTLAINILVGMNVNNFSKYLPYLIIPIASSLMIIFDYFVKVAMFKVKLFREEV